MVDGTPLSARERAAEMPAVPPPIMSTPLISPHLRYGPGTDTDIGMLDRDGPGTILEGQYGSDFLTSWVI
jgi:hypothetical protein